MPATGDEQPSSVEVALEFDTDSGEQLVAQAPPTTPSEPPAEQPPPSEPPVEPAPEPSDAAAAEPTDDAGQDDAEAVREETPTTVKGAAVEPTAAAEEQAAVAPDAATEPAAEPPLELAPEDSSTGTEKMPEVEPAPELEPAPESAPELEPAPELESAPELEPVPEGEPAAEGEPDEIPAAEPEVGQPAEPDSERVLLADPESVEITLPSDDGTEPISTPVEIVDEHSAGLPPFEEGAEVSPFEEEPTIESVRSVDAVVGLMQSGRRDAWAERAAWLYDEAPAKDQPTQRAQALAVVVELLAMSGEEARAHEVAEEAFELGPNCPIVQRQLRGLRIREGDWQGVLEQLDAEGRAAPSPQAQAHAYCLGAAISRLALGDQEGATKRYDLARGVNHEDLRPYVFQLAQGLASADEVPDISFPERSTKALVRGCGILGTIRSDGNETSPKSTPYTRFLDARGALRRRHVADAVEALRDLEKGTEMGPGAAWLLSSLAGPQQDIRVRSIAALGRVLNGSHGPPRPRMARRGNRGYEIGD